MPGDGKTVFFIINLLQDLNIVRSLVYLTVRETEARVGFLISERFFKRDQKGIWQRELAEIAAEVGASVHRFGTPAEAFAVLQGGSGMIFAASESSLNAHAEATEVFRIAPPGYLRVTLQHGFECVGFLQGREHVASHGRNISFGSDIVCSWFDAPALTSMIAAERAKLYVSGPPTLLLQQGRHPDHPPTNGGIVCENMHSVRFQVATENRMSFMDTFFAYCALMAEQGAHVTLRPHPGGQFVLKNNIALPDNVHLNNLPMYRVNLKAYRYGISAPSTVLFDMVLAGIPVGVWRDPESGMDAGNYDGLTEISTLDDWLAFERDVRLRPDMLLERQRAFLARLSMPTDPAEIYRRFARLIVAGLSLRTRPEPSLIPAPKPPAVEMPRRVVFVANSMLPTLQLCLLKPLAPLFESGEIEYTILTSDDVKAVFGKKWSTPAANDWLVEQILAFKPDLIVCCRYSAPDAQVVVDCAKANNIPLVFHVDDDLLNVPRELGEKKWLAHNQPERLESVTNLLKGADLRYCSTRKLKERFRKLNFYGPMVAGEINCASTVLRPAELGPVRKIGYMGFDHAHDFEIALPAVELYLQQNPDVSFELFGSIPLPDCLRKFGDRVVEVAPVRDYEAFLQTLADRKWDIGICPLARTPFNEVKSNNKWVEYTACGMATIATKGLIYDSCAAEGRGRLVWDDGWYQALKELTDNPEERFATAQRAQQHLRDTYSDERLRKQILNVFETAARLVREPEYDTANPPLATLRHRVALNELGATK